MEPERVAERDRDALWPAARLREPLVLRARLLTERLFVALLFAALLFRPRLVLLDDLVAPFFFPPPSCLFTVAQARAAAVFELTPRFL